MEGDLVAVGGNGCDMSFVGADLHTPECSKDMWVAIQAVDSEATSLGGHSLGGIKASMQWCGQDVVTDEDWECSTVGERGWQNPLADGMDPRMMFQDAVPDTYNNPGALDCKNRALPSCSWLHRKTEQISEMEADCASRTTSATCVPPAPPGQAHSTPNQYTDTEGRGVCRWEPASEYRVSNPCGVQGPFKTPIQHAGTCKLDLTCTHFSKADLVDGKFKDTDQIGQNDDISNALDSRNAKWIWVDKDTKDWDVQDAQTACSRCGREEPSNDPCTENECEAVDSVCKWYSESSSGPPSQCQPEKPQRDEDTVYCRKHVQCTDNQTPHDRDGNPITCEASWDNQKRNLTLGCGQCQMCKNLAYQSPGDKATTTTCVQAYNEPCEGFYKQSACVDPILSHEERTKQGKGQCPDRRLSGWDGEKASCTAVEGCVYTDAIEAEGTSCPAKWGGIIPKLTISKDSTWESLTMGS